MRRRRIDQVERDDGQFEQALMIHRPEAYQEYKRNKETLQSDNSGYDQIVWRAPESIEEAMEITNLVAEAHRDLEDNDDFDQRLEELHKAVNGIDTSLLGDDDG